jgi:hypothetical protein
MRVIRLVPLLLTFMLVGGQVLLLLPSPAYARCCSWTWCHLSGCSCPGQDSCPTYRSPMNDHDAVQAYAPISDGTVNIRAARSLDATDREVYLTKVGDCARRSFAMAILGDAGKALEVESFNLDQKATDDGALSFQVAVNMER